MSTELNQHSAWPAGPDRVSLYVDFNEMVDTDCYLLSKTDIKADRYGNQIRIVENMPIVGFMDDIDQNGEPGILTVDGYAELNDGTGGWSAEQEGERQQDEREQPRVEICGETKGTDESGGTLVH